MYAICVDSNQIVLASDVLFWWRRHIMLWTLFVILLVLWLLGLVTAYTFGGFIHILLVVAVAVLLIQLVTGRRVV